MANKVLSKEQLAALAEISKEKVAAEILKHFNYDVSIGVESAELKYDEDGDLEGTCTVVFKVYYIEEDQYIGIFGY